MMLALALPILALAQPADPPSDAYAFAHVVLQHASDWSAISDSLCNMNPEFVAVDCPDGGCGELAPLDCGARVFELTCDTGESVRDDRLQVWCPDPAGAAAGTLHQARREHRAARWTLVFTEHYVPLASPREDMILHTDDPADVIIARTSSVTDSTLDGIRPWGKARVYTSGLPEQSAVRVYGVSASGVRALGPAVGVSESAAESASDSSEGESTE